MAIPLTQIYSENYTFQPFISMALSKQNMQTFLHHLGPNFVSENIFPFSSKIEHHIMESHLDYFQFKYCFRSDSRLASCIQAMCTEHKSLCFHPEIFSQFSTFCLQGCEKHSNFHCIFATAISLESRFQKIYVYAVQPFNTNFNDPCISGRNPQLRSNLWLALIKTTKSRMDENSNFL